MDKEEADMYFDSPRGKVTYEFTGKEDAPVLVFLHGVATDKETFRSQIERFQDDHRVLIFDLPGHGESYKKEETPSITEAVEALKELLDHLGLDTVVLVGLSMGALVAQCFAFHHPERVRALVDVGAMPFHIRLPRWYFFLAKVALPMVMLIPKKLFFRLFAFDKAVRKSTRAYLYECGLRTGKRAVLKHTKAMMEALREGIDHPPACPVLMMHGTKDVRFLIKSSRRYAKGAENARQVMVNNAGHIANADEPARFNDILENFLKEIL